MEPPSHQPSDGPRLYQPDVKMEIDDDLGMLSDATDSLMGDFIPGLDDGVSPEDKIGTAPTPHEFDPMLKELEEKSHQGLNVLEKLETILQKHPSCGINETWAKQVQEVVKLGKTNPRVVIGVVGSTGAGKSSVINALLEEERLVPTSSMRACTATITEISYNYGPDKYEAEVQFISRSDWEHQMGLLLGDIHDVSNDILETAPHDNSEFGISCAKFQAVYKLPLQGMKHMSIDELMKKNSVSSVLSSTEYISGNDAATFFEKLRQYVDSEDATRAPDDRRPKMTNLETSSMQVPNPSQKMELWPLVELVRLRVKAPVLSTGVLIVDLPGLLDFNTARGSLAKQYIQQCSSLWIVAPITRAVDDHTARTLLGENFKRQLQLDGGLNAITFVCSKTDDINLSETADDLELRWEKEELNDLSNNTKSRIRLLNHRIQSLQGKEQRASASLTKVVDELVGSSNGPDLDGPSPSKRKLISHFFPNSVKRQHTIQGAEPFMPQANDADDFTPIVSPQSKGKREKLLATKKKLEGKKACVAEELQVLRAEVQSLQEQLQEKKNEFQLKCIGKRNEYSRKSIRDDFVAGIRQLNFSDTGENDEDDMVDYQHIRNSLPVFCVSAKAYQKLKGRFLREPPVNGFMTLEETEIPQLQLHCLKEGVAAQRVNHENFLNNFGQLVNSLRIQSASHDTPELKEMRDQDRDALRAKLNTLQKLFHSATLNVSAKYLAKLREGLFENLERASLIAMAAADSTPLKWNKSFKDGGVHWATYRAICRRSGEFKNYKGKYDWNFELGNPMMAIVGPVWEKTFSRRLPKILKAFSIDFRGFIDEFNNDVTRDIQSIAASQPRSKLLKEQSLRYQEKVKQTFTYILEKTQEKQKKLNRTFIPAIASALRPAYAEAGALRGPGTYEQMKSIIAERVNKTHTRMFKKNTETVQKSLEELAQELEHVLRSAIGKIFDSISHDYMADLEGFRSEVEKPLKEEVLSFLDNTTRVPETEDVKLEALDDEVAAASVNTAQPLDPMDASVYVKPEPEEPEEPDNLKCL
ncbi:hypothetical protein FQN49_004865 [Arthroderma sp. PD_2]|nr:hypothetical protein FQN49_004865 [Arthroderma sp. PD_2]